MKLTERFNDALVYAARLHADQVRKGNERIPYVAHLLGVASLTLEYGGDEDQAIAALLHDAVEDQGGTPQLEQIRRQFGEKVAQIVADCSDAFETPKPPWQQRKEAYIKHLAQISADSLLVSCADKVHNIRSISKDYLQMGETLWQRFQGGRNGTLRYYRSLSNTFQVLFPSPIQAELEQCVLEIERLTSNPEGSNHPS
jgi:GTP pyrophosphokinase